MIISTTEMIARLLLASVLGAVVGYEREQHDQPAGLRTHMILTIGAALAMMLSIQLAADYRDIVPNGDPARLAAQVISGIGFLGAGAIIRYGSTVRGLTTATSLWTIAIIGLAVGSGYYVGAVVAVVLSLLILDTIDRLEKRFIQVAAFKTVIVNGMDRPGLVERIQQSFLDLGLEVKSLSVAKNLQKTKVVLKTVVKMASQDSIDRLTDTLSEIDGVTGFEIK